MAKLEITVEEARRAFNNAWADLMNCFTAKYGTTYGNPATVKETPAPDGADDSDN